MSNRGKFVGPDDTAGTWSDEEVKTYEKDTAGFSEIEPTLRR